MPNGDDDRAEFERNQRIKARKKGGPPTESDRLRKGGPEDEEHDEWPVPEMHDGSLPPPVLTEEHRSVTRPQRYGPGPAAGPQPADIPAPTLLSVKDTNPKDAVGTQKWRQYCTVPTTIIWELGVAMLEGARKYGRHNYRIAGVRASVYVDAAKGHIDQWWEGEDIDTESKLNHIVKAIASLAVLRDAMIQDKWVDDRPPKTDLDKLRGELQDAVDGIFERIPEAKAAYLEGDQYDDPEE